MQQQVQVKGMTFNVTHQIEQTYTFKVGDAVKLLKKKYSDEFTSHYGVVVSIDLFKTNPNIVVAYLEVEYSTATIKIQDINDLSKDIQLCHCPEAELRVDKSEILRVMDKDIEKKREEVKELECKRKYFLERFTAYFSEGL